MRRVPRVVGRSLLRVRTGGMAPQTRPCLCVDQGRPLSFSWMMLGPNVTACPLGRTDPYQARYEYKKRGLLNRKSSCTMSSTARLLCRPTSPTRTSLCVSLMVSTRTSTMRQLKICGTYLLCFTFKFQIYLLPTRMVPSIVL